MSRPLVDWIDTNCLDKALSDYPVLISNDLWQKKKKSTYITFLRDIQWFLPCFIKLIKKKTIAFSKQRFNEINTYNVITLTIVRYVYANLSKIFMLEALKAN